MNNVATEEKSLATVQSHLVQGVMGRVAELQKSGQLTFPPNYNPQNAIMAAGLVLQQTLNRDKLPVLSVCTPASVANALLDMVVQGLNPVKKQCYFVAYGKALTCMRSYFGTVAVTQRVTGAKSIYAEVVYEGDVFKFEIKRGNTLILEHSRELKNIDKAKIVAAYCTIITPDNDEPYTQIMTIGQIHEAWKKSQNNPVDGEGNIRSLSVHGQFAEEMAKKTVTNRTCKMLINSSSDASLDILVHHMNRADDAADEAEFAEEVATSANGEIIDVEATVTEVEPQQSEPPPTPPAEPAPAAKGKKAQEPDF